ncbi:hypothetical protein CO676_33345 [Sinorhizobium sp. BJ1]|nr:hypothetical protein CO676_33345 [Sinorhizobium sp. BJ1]
MPRQIGEPTLVMAVDARSSRAATGATCFFRCRARNKHNPIGLRKNLDYRKLGRNQRAKKSRTGKSLH